jgi:hypothetical protein
MILSLLRFHIFLIFLHYFISMSFSCYDFIYSSSRTILWARLFSAALFCVYLPAQFYGHPYFFPASLFNIPYFPALFNDHVYSFLVPIFHISHFPALPCKHKSSCVSQIYICFLLSNLENTDISMTLTIPSTRNFGIIALWRILRVKLDRQEGKKNIQYESWK